MVRDEMISFLIMFVVFILLPYAYHIYDRRFQFTRTTSQSHARMTLETVAITIRNSQSVFLIVCKVYFAELLTSLLGTIIIFRYIIKTIINKE